MTLGHLFQPDVMTPAQWERLVGGRKIYPASLVALARALIEASIEVLRRGPMKPGARKRIEGSFEDDHDWLTHEDESYPFTFRSCCEIVGLDADYMRAGIIRGLGLEGGLRSVRHARVGRPRTGIVEHRNGQSHRRVGP